MYVYKYVYVHYIYLYHIDIDVRLSIHKDQQVNDCTKRSCCLQFLDFLGAKEPLTIASFRYHLDCELFPRVAATMTSK